MNKWVISKQFDFCYGHRVHSQVLDKDLSCNSACKCRHLHGHQGTIIVHLEGNELDKRGMFIDFNELNWFKKWVDDTLDHKMILDESDPALGLHFPLVGDLNTSFIHSSEGFRMVDPNYISHLASHVKEIYEGLVLVPFVPTSENLSKWLWQVVNSKIGHLCKVSRIQFFETPKSQSNYYAE